MAKSIPGVFVPTRYVVEVGLAQAHLLAQIIYWFSKASNGNSHFIVNRFEHRWLAHTRKQLMDETGLTPSALKGALKRLTDQGVIVVEQHLFCSKNVSYIRLHEECPSWVGEGLPLGVELTDLLEMAANATSLKKQTQVKTDQDFSADGAGLPFGKNKLIEKGQTEPCDKGLGSSGPAYLGGIFQKSYESAYPTEFLAPLTGKQLGQLKLFAAACPAQSAGPVLDWCVRNWYLFTSQAEAKQGAFKSPERPTLSYLLQYVQTAVNAHKVNTETFKPPKPIPAKVTIAPAPTPVAKPPLDPDDKLITIEDMEKMFALEGVDPSVWYLTN